MTPRDARSRSLTVIGAGNIGTHLLPHLGRLHEVGRLTLVDPDHYEHHNIGGQAISPRDVGRRKVDVQARRLTEIAPELEVRAIAARVENVPLGLLRADVIAACLDSRAARHIVGRAATRLGVPWVDSGVEASGLLARVNVYLPGTEQPCIECAHDGEAEETALQRYPCAEARAAHSAEGASPEAAPTNAPSALGALAAALQAIECKKLLDGEVERAIVGREVLLDARWHKHTLTSARRNPACRFDHAVWRIEALPAAPDEISLGAALRLVPAGERLRLDGHRFVTRLACAACGRERSLLHVAARLRAARARCAACRAPLVPRGFDLVDALAANQVSPRTERTALASLGLRSGDVFTVESPAGAARFELSAVSVPRGHRAMTRGAPAGG